MTKTAKKTTDAFAMPSMDATPFIDQFRSAAEQAVTKSQDAYAQMKDAAEQAQKTIETTFETAQSNAKSMTLKAIDAYRTNVNASLAHFESLVGAKTFAEAIELQTAFIRKQAELTVDQAKEMQAMSQKAAEEVSAPAKQAVEKVVETVKAAA
ncbi:MAG TPA: phasin [Rhizobiaceae bacterium]|nr:phasin [Rhizobiaceae bacterium]